MHGDDENRGFKGLGKLAANQPPPMPPGAGQSPPGPAASPEPGTPPPKEPPPEPPPGGGRPHTGQISPPPGPGGSQPWTPPPKPGGGSGCAKAALIVFILFVLFAGTCAVLVRFVGGGDPDSEYTDTPSGDVTDPAEAAALAAQAQADLAEAEAEQARLDACRQEAGAMPETGEVLVRDLETGGHTLKINGGDSDGLIKLRRDDATVLAFYVRANDTATIEDIPDGTYRIMFASGSDFSRGCGEFVTGMSVSGDPNPVEFAPIVENGDQYYAIVEYTLTRQVGGNFEPAYVDPESFRD